MRTRPLFHMIFAFPVCSAECWIKLLFYYHLPELTNQNRSKCTLSFLHESDSDHYSTSTTMQVNSDIASQGFVRLLLSWPCLQGTYLLWLANFAGVWHCNSRVSNSITVLDIYSGNHLFFLSKFLKVAFLSLEEVAESAVGPLSIYVISLHIKTHFILLIHDVPDSKWSTLEHAAWWMVHWLSQLN